MNLDVKKLENIINSAADSLNIELKEYDFELCNEIYNKSKEIEALFKKSINKEISQKEIDFFENPIIQTMLDIYIEKFNIEVVDDDYILNEDNEPLLSTYKLYIRDMLSFKIPTQEEERILFYKYKNGDLKAREELINRNQRLVIRVAKKYVTDYYDILSAIQDGNFGLINAIDRFDVTKGYKLSSYALCSIRRSIFKERQKNSYVIRLTGYTQNQLDNYYKYTNDYEIKYGVVPTIEEASKALNISVERLNEILSLPIANVSINSKVDLDDDDTELEGIISSGDKFITENIVMDKYLKNDLYETMDKLLNERQKAVLIYRYGLKTGAPLKYREIASILGVSHQRVEELEKASLKKLRYYGRKLQDYCK